MTGLTQARWHQVSAADDVIFSDDEIVGVVIGNDTAMFHHPQNFEPRHNVVN